MKYMLLIYTAEDAGPAVGTPEAELEMKRYFEFSEEVAKKGLVVGGDPLEPSEHRHHGASPRRKAAHD